MDAWLHNPGVEEFVQMLLLMLKVLVCGTFVDLDVFHEHVRLRWGEGRHEREGLEV